MINLIKQVYEYVKDNEFRFTVFVDRVHVINYKSIMSLQNEEISFKGDRKMVLIKGKNLRLNKLLDSELLIVGDIFKIEVFND